jgi:hypothetical protein
MTGLGSVFKALFPYRNYLGGVYRGNMNNALLKGLEDLKKQRKDNILSPKPIENIDLEAVFNVVRALTIS